MMYAFALPDVPDMNYAVPPSRNNRMLVDEFDSEDSIIMAYVVPASRLEVMNHRLCVYSESKLTLVVNSDVTIFASRGKNLASP